MCCFTLSGLVNLITTNPTASNTELEPTGATWYKGCFPLVSTKRSTGTSQKPWGLGQ